MRVALFCSDLFWRWQKWILLPMNIPLRWSLLQFWISIIKLLFNIRDLNFYDPRLKLILLNLIDFVIGVLGILVLNDSQLNFFFFIFVMIKSITVFSALVSIVRVSVSNDLGRTFLYVRILVGTISISIQKFNGWSWSWHHFLLRRVVLYKHGCCSWVWGGIPKRIVVLTRT